MGTLNAFYVRAAAEKAAVISGAGGRAPVTLTLRGGIWHGAETPARFRTASYVMVREIHSWRFLWKPIA